MLCAIATALSALVGAARAAAPPPNEWKRVVFHDDAQSLREAADAADPEPFLRQFIRREIDDVPITTFCYIAALPDVCLYDTKAGEVRGARVKKPDDPYRALHRLHAQGTDVLKIAIGELRPRGLEILAAIRMGDTHFRRIDPDDPRCSQFLLDHPQYVIRQPDGRTNETALDYSHADVRAYRFGIMRELAEKYDIDGLELNFCRMGKHFPRDKGREKAHIMTAFMGEIRAMLDAASRKRTRDRLTLGVRVPEGIRECWLAGLDPKTWVERGWIDYLTVATFNETDPQVPVEEFTSLTAGRNCQVLVAMGNMMGGVWTGLPKITDRGTAQFRECYYGMLLTPAEARACAANYEIAGADGISFWNISCNMGTKGKFCSPTNQKLTHAWMRAVIDRPGIWKAPRRYHYLPIYKWTRDVSPPARNYAFYDQGQSPLGTRKTQILRFPPTATGKRQTYRFRMADGRNGETLSGTLRFRIFHLRPEDRLAIDVNGAIVDRAKTQRSDLDPNTIGLPGAAFEVAFEDCPPLRGRNELGLTLESTARGGEVPYMEELDILVE